MKYFILTIIINLILINYIESKDVIPRNHHHHLPNEHERPSPHQREHMTAKPMIPINPCLHGDYDFTGFNNASSYQYKYIDYKDMKEYTLYWNVCNKQSFGASKCNNDRDDSICERSYDTYRVLGNTNTATFQEFTHGDKYDRQGGIITYSANNIIGCPNLKSTVHISLFCSRYSANRILSVHMNRDACETNIHLLGDSGCPVLFKPIYKLILVVSSIIIILVALLTACTYCIHLLHKQYHDRKKRLLKEQSQSLLINGEPCTPGNDDEESNSWK